MKKQHKSKTSGTLELIFFNMRAKGNRITDARKKILEVLLDENHLSVKEIHERIGVENISSATIYNNINYLVDEGYIYTSTSLGAKIYCVNSPRHYHEKCPKCGQVFYIESNQFDNIKPTHISRNFMVEVQGICNDCIKK